MPNQYTRNPSAKIARTCAHCGSTFYVDPSTAKYHPAKYCSLACCHPLSVTERLWSKIAKGESDNCWLWTAGRDHDGYGRMSVRDADGKQHWKKASRLVWEEAYGPIPEGMNVCHACDNPPCCNPHHFFLGTDAVNVADRTRKGRTASGASHGTHTKPESVTRGDRHWTRAKRTAAATDTNEPDAITPTPQGG